MRDIPKRQVRDKANNSQAVPSLNLTDTHLITDIEYSRTLDIQQVIEILQKSEEGSLYIRQNESTSLE
jgi:hypothetical protein